MVTEQSKMVTFGYKNGNRMVTEKTGKLVKSAQKLHFLVFFTIRLP